MRGDLVERTAADLCRDLAAMTATGILTIDGPDGPARVVVVDGRIIAAASPAPRARLGERLVGAGELDPDDLAAALRTQEHDRSGERLGPLLVERGLVRADALRRFAQEQVLDALFEIIGWRYGTYVFTANDDPAAPGAPVSLTVHDALADVARRQRDWQQLSRVIPDLAAVPSSRQGTPGSAASLEPDESTLLAGVDGERSIRTLADDLGYGEFEAARIVYGLSRRGIVDVRPPQDAIGAALEDALALGPADRTGDRASRSRPTPAPDFFAANPAAATEEATPQDSRPDAATSDAVDETPDAPDDMPDEAPDDTPDEVDDRLDAADEMLDVTIEVDPARPSDRPEPEETRPAAVFAALYGDPPRAPADEPDAPPEEDAAQPSSHPSDAPERGDDSDVSEFLRELSRLSVDPPERSTPSPPRQTTDPPPPSESGSGRKKKRGLFGRG